MENQNEHTCPFCKEPYFYEVKRSIRKIYWQCGKCGTKRDKPLKNIDIREKDANYFHIHEPYYGAWVEYGWAKDDWGIGLHKDRIDALASKGIIVWVSFGKDAETKYYIRSAMVQTFPVRPVYGKNVDLYIVPRSKLTKLQKDVHSEVPKQI